MPIGQSSTNPDAHVRVLEGNGNGTSSEYTLDLSNGGSRVPAQQHIPGESAASIFEGRYRGPSWKAGPMVQLGSALVNMSKDRNSNPINAVYDQGPLFSAGVGAAGGLLGAMLLNNTVVPDEFHRGTTILTPILAAGAAAVGQGLYSTPFYKRSSKSMYKSSAMYQDARNFVLEKLQGASDISSVEKATLASKIRNMSTGEAERLKTMVRAAVGFGIGRLIARFFFGARGASSFVGGAVGALTSLIAGAVRNNAPNSMFQGSQYY